MAWDTALSKLIFLAMIFVVCALPLVGTWKAIKTQQARYIVIPFALLLVLIGLCSPGSLLLIGLTAGIFFVGIGIFHWREQSYQRNYPVFETEAIRSMTSDDGFIHLLHIAAVESGFIIGIVYETRVDGTAMTIQTRWRDVFPDYCSAEQALLKRFDELASPPWSPPGQPN